MTDETHTPRVRRMLRAVIAAYVAAFVLSASAVFVSIATSTKAISESEQKWCALLVPLDDGYKVTPPPTESGQRFARIIHGLRVDFGC